MTWHCVAWHGISIPGSEQGMQGKSWRTQAYPGKARRRSSASAETARRRRVSNGKGSVGRSK